MTCPFDTDCGYFNGGQGIKEHCVTCRKKEENLEDLRPKKRKLLMFSVSKENQRTLIRRIARRLPIAQGKYINAMLDGCSSREIAIMYGIKDSSDVRKTIRRALKNIEKLVEVG